MAIIQNLLMSIPPFVVVLSVVVFVHEFGHFQAARWRKVAVDTFSIGFGKALFSWHDKQGVRWKVGMLPLGGYVKFADDADGVSMGPREPIEDPAAKAEARAKGMFHAQSLLTRSIVVAAGPFTNFVFAIAAFAVIAMIIGRDITDYGTFTPRIGGVAAHSAAASAGLRVGDVIASVDGKPIANWSAFQQAITHSNAHPLALTLTHDGASRSVSVTPTWTDRPAADGTVSRVPVLGVALDQGAGARVIDRVNPLDALKFGGMESWALVSQTATYVGGMVTGKNSGRDISGPLGILSTSGQVAKSALAAPHQTPWEAGGTLALYLLQLAAMLSVAVGIVNILPIPILDGGHLLFYVIEAIRGGKPLPPAAQEWAFRAGLAVMASLFLFATWNDVTHHLWSQG